MARAILLLVALAVGRPLLAEASVEILPAEGALIFDVIVTSDVGFRGGELGIAYRDDLLSLARVERGADFPSGEARFAVDLSPDNGCADADLGAGATILWVHSLDGSAVLPAGTYRLLSLHFEAGPRFDVGGCLDVAFRECLGPATAPVRNVITLEDGRSDRLGTRAWGQFADPVDLCEQIAIVVAAGAEENVPLSLSGCARAACVQIRAPAGKSIILSLDDARDANVNALYAKWGRPATSTRFDAVAARPDQADQRLVLPESRGDVLFVRVESVLQDAPSDLVLTARVAELALESMSPKLGAEGGRVSATIRGGGFETGNTRFALAESGGRRRVEADPERTTIVAAGRAEVVFVLGDAPRGAYDLTVEKEAASATIEEALEIVAPDLANGLRVILTGNELYRNRVPAPMTLQFENIADLERTAPLFRISVAEGLRGNVGLRLAADPVFRGEDLLALGRGPSGFAGRLPSGLTTELPIVFQSRDCLSCEARFDVSLFTPLDIDEVEWGALPPPAGVPAEDWPRLAARLGERLGSTWGEAHEQLAQIATRLTRRGLDTTSYATLFAFAAREALGRPSAAVLGRVVEAETAAPVAGATVIALRGDEVRSFGVTDSRGTFAIDWLRNSETYRIEVGDRVGSVEIVVPDTGDAYDVELAVNDVATAREAACPNCDLAGLPEAPILPPNDLFTRVTSFETLIGAAIDPNEKSGTEGEGDDDLVDSNKELFYTIYFENLPGALFPAQKVVITDTLDPDLDWTTITLRDVYVGGDFISLGQFGTDRHNGYRRTSTDGVYMAFLRGRERSYSMRIDDEIESFSVLFDLEIEVDLEAGRIVWAFQTLDPATGQPPDPNSRMGFLPPNDPAPPRGNGSGQGEGYVRFSVFSRDDLGEGDPLENSAIIRFDDETVFKTNVVTNRFSTFPPAAMPRFPVPASSRVRAVPLATDLCWQPAAFAVTYDVFVWKDGAPKPAAPILAGVKTTCVRAPFDLEPGVIYLWQVVARNVRGEATDGEVWTFRTGGSSFGPMVRGDCNGDGRVVGQVGDAIFLLNWKFTGGVGPTCHAACDTNGDGRVDVADAVYVLNHNFGGGPAPPAPFPECGFSTREGDLVLGCQEALTEAACP